VAHALGQGGKGSGGDVAASFAGGVLRYRRYEVAGLGVASNVGGFRAALMESAPVDVWRLPPPKVSLAYAFTGESASTRVLISQVEARWDEAARQAFVTRSDAVGHEMEVGLGGGDFRALKEAVTAQQSLLQELGPTETEAMRRILAIAASYGCTGKQSGAGGGDGCILFAPNAETRAELMKGLEARGFHSMTLEVEPGLRGEAQADPRLRAWLDAHA
jgi:phosphomevalonate kinase